MTNSDANYRYTYLDNMRGILMSLGLVLHTCAAFSATGYWLVTYPESIPWADSVSEVIHFFRMPLFFAISGFFAFILLNKLSSLRFLRNKLMRIGLPLVSAFVVLILPQQFLINHLHLNTSLQINQLPLISHLWFLINLLVYFIVAMAIFSLVRSTQNKLLQATIATRSLLASLALLVIPVVYLVLLALNKIGIPIYTPIPLVSSIYQLFFYVDYFLFGFFLAAVAGKVLQDVMVHPWFAILVIVLLVVSIIQWTTNVSFGLIMDTWLERWAVISSSLLIWITGSKLLNRNFTSLNWIVRASYTIYLFHHLLIVVLVTLFSLAYSHFPEHRMLKEAIFAAVILLTLLLTGLIHSLLIDRYKILKTLFNGK